MKSVLAALNCLAMLMLFGMSDLAVSIRLVVATVVALNLALLVGRSALSEPSARWGAVASLSGYVGAVVFWLVMAFGCGIEYFNRRCDAIVTPLVAAAVIVGVTGLPVGRFGALFARR